MSKVPPDPLLDMEIVPENEDRVEESSGSFIVGQVVNAISIGANYLAGVVTNVQADNMYVKFPLMT